MLKTVDIIDEDQSIDFNKSLKSDTFLIRNHYDSNTSQGIIIDTAASQYSAAGYLQYQAFVKTLGHLSINYGKTISVRYGIGLTSSI
ncbi:hypothetical protein OnM2_033052 [Erysiphe neolycopersici]|uniref:Uncharacterized protein n=1 Tax=Erysiphe neolycopersici TaxID=212602 RepID=A0A420HYJ1_9PEZI|nr:hypothetical protein OnM2_033052 [Erysiphe neolycopersici]